MSRKSKKKSNRISSQVPAIADANGTKVPSEAHGAAVQAASHVMVEKNQDSKEKALADAITKYRELYAYSTEILLKEHERFNRADEKASKYSTIFVFLIGIGAYFDKWTFDRIVKQPQEYVDLPPEWPVMVTATIALLLAGIGWYLANRVIMMRPYASRPLSNEVVDFFDKQPLLNIYDSFARRNITAYEENKGATNKKYRTLIWTHRLMIVSLLFIASSLLSFALYSLF